MSSQWLSAQISRATGLPESDVMEQIIPNLAKMSSKSQVEQFIYEICGTEPAVLTFVSAYLDSRFPASLPVSRPQSATTSRGGSPFNSRPSTPSHGHRQNVSRGKEATAAVQEPPAKSRPIRKLERLVARLDTIDFGRDTGDQSPDDERDHERDAEEMKGCFCQARMHPLSHYTPMCPHCGLILCSLQLPHLPCPSCNDWLLNPVSRERVKKKLQEEIKDVMAKEQAERDRIQAEKRHVLEAESGGGMFPTLGGVQVKPEKETKTRRVLTIGGSKTVPPKGKAKPSSGTSTPILTTYRPKIPLSQAAQDALLDREERKKMGRVERPFCFDLEPYEAREERQRKARVNEEWKRKEGRLWADMDFASMGMQIEYVSPAQAVAAASVIEEPRAAKPIVPGAEVKVPKAKASKTKKKPAKLPNLEQEQTANPQPPQNVGSIEGS